MVVPVLLFILGLLLLVKGGDWFVDGATGIARKLHISELIIGATIVSIGTTLPEVMVSVTAAASGQGATAYGNAIGSIICNTSLIAALTMAIRPPKVGKKSIILPVAFFLGTAAIYSAVAYTTGKFTRVMGIGLLAIFLVYMVVLIWYDKKLDAAEGIKEPDKGNKGKEVKTWLLVLLLVIGAAMIAVGAKLLVDNGIKIAEAIGVPESVIALTFVALGTSLPELVTAITSLAKGHGTLSLGNIIGANLLNLVFVSGLSMTVAPFSIPAEKLIGGMNASLVVDIPLMLAVMLVMTVPYLIHGKSFRWQGILLLGVYAAYCVFQFVL